MSIPKLVSVLSFVAIAAIQLYEEPFPTVVGERFKLTCITTDQIIMFQGDGKMVAVITGGDRLGKCNISGSYITNFTYFCFTNNYTYTVVIPGNSNDKDLNGSLWSCEGFLNGERQMIQHISKYPDVTVKSIPENIAFVNEGTSVTFLCDFPVRESWQATEFTDSLLGEIVRFERNGSICATTGLVLRSYNVTCNLTQVIFSATLLETSLMYNKQRIICRVQYGTGDIASDKYFGQTTMIKLSGQHKLYISPTGVSFGSDTTVVLSCYLNQYHTEVYWNKNSRIFKRIVAANGTENCNESTVRNHGLKYRCHVNNRLYELVILPKYVTYGLKNASWTCSSSDGTNSNTATFRVTGIPEIFAVDSVNCTSPANVMLACNLNTSSISYVKEAEWYHSVNGKVICTLKGTWEGVSFKLRKQFCTIHDTGVYKCSVKTDLPDLETIEKDVTLSVIGPPLFVNKTSTKLETSVDLTAAFYSYTVSGLPIWKYQNRTLNPGTKYYTETSEGQIKTMFYNKEVTLNGFVSTLSIFEYNDKDDGEYTVTVQNSVSHVMETITVSFSSIPQNQGNIQNMYSSGVLGAVAVSCILGTALLATLGGYIIIKKLRLSGAENKDAPKTEQNYDELEIRSLPSVYETVQ